MQEHHCVVVCELEDVRVSIAEGFVLPHFLDETVHVANQLIAGVFDVKNLDEVVF